jgi:hypothetical protein
MEAEDRCAAARVERMLKMKDARGGVCFEPSNPLGKPAIDRHWEPFLILPRLFELSRNRNATKGADPQRCKMLEVFSSESRFQRFSLLNGARAGTARGAVARSSRSPYEQPAARAFFSYADCLHTVD